MKIIKSFSKIISNWKHFRRFLFYLFVDAFLLVFSVIFSFLLRFDWTIPSQYIGEFRVILPVFLLVKIGVLYIHGLYHISWTYLSVKELSDVFRAISISSLVLGALLFFLRFQPFFKGFPRSILLIDFLLSLVSIGGFRAAKRVYLHFFQNI